MTTTTEAKIYVPKTEAKAAARTYYGELLKMCQKADSPGRPELAEARKAVAGS